MTNQLKKLCINYNPFLIFSFSFRSSERLKILKGLFILTFFVISCNGSSKNSKKADLKNDINHTQQEISLDKKIGQMLMIGFRGLTVAESKHIKRDIQDFNLGGVVLYSLDLPSSRKLVRNIASPAQLKTLNAELQALSPISLLIGIDQEGGRVSRLSPKYGFPTKAPSAQYLGSLNNLDSTRYWATQTAELLKAHHINFNFAPVVDVNINPACPVIGGLERSFSADAAVVTAHATEIIKANKALQIICSLKHFPGHGSAKVDSHKGFADVTNTWQKQELLPYKNLIEQNTVEAIMTAHVFNANLDKKYPATLSRKTTYHLLREEYKWQGFIISDDMHMGAIADNFPLEEAIEKALDAGVDMLMFSNNSPKPYNSEIVPKAIEIIKKLIAEGKITEKRIEESYQRILKLKAQL